MVLYKSEPEVMGQIKDVGLGGVAFDSTTRVVPDDDHLELDLLMAEQGIYLHNIPFVRVPARSADGDTHLIPQNHTHILQFKDLDGEQAARLQELLTHQVGTPNAGEAMPEAQGPKPGTGAPGRGK
ncbi:hypothetical protein [Desulfosarcina sp.]|uniref:hypothetical protein n=1 Tax=Desulfosarcina sp. TaxID=2027861 RepID=UPI0039706698